HEIKIESKKRASLASFEHEEESSLTSSAGLADVTQSLERDCCTKLDALLLSREDLRTVVLTWLRQPARGKPKAGNLLAHLDRLHRIREVNLPGKLGQVVHQSRLAPQHPDKSAWIDRIEPVKPPHIGERGDPLALYGLVSLPGHRAASNIRRPQQKLRGS